MRDMIRFLRDAWEECAPQIIVLLAIAGVVAFGVHDLLARANVRNDLVPSGVIVGDPDALIRFVDAEAGVVCYCRVRSSATLDCLPIGETRLGP